MSSIFDMTIVHLSRTYMYSIPIEGKSDQIGAVCHMVDSPTHIL